MPACMHLMPALLIMMMFSIFYKHWPLAWCSSTEQGTCCNLPASAHPHHTEQSCLRDLDFQPPIG